MTTIKKTLLAVAVSAAFATSPSIAGDIVSIDPDGSEGLYGSLDISALDWNFGNVLITPVAGTVTDPEVGDIFQNYAHAAVSGFNDADGNTLVSPSVSTFEWTYVLGFQETAVDVDGVPPVGSATFRTIAGGDNFFRIYFDTTPDANNLPGTGFAGNDTGANGAVLILEATVLPWTAGTDGQTSFAAQGAVDNAGNPIPLDAFGANNYPAIFSITGTGGGVLALETTYANTEFFKNGAPSVFKVSLDTQLNLNFKNTNPSCGFWDGSAYISGAGPYTSEGSSISCFTGASNTLGRTNGAPSNGPNEIQTTDSGISFNRSIPEPGSLALLGIGLVGLGFGRARRKA